jgi:hypothetical protein
MPKFGRKVWLPTIFSNRANTDTVSDIWQNSFRILTFAEVLLTSLKFRQSHFLTAHLEIINFAIAGFRFQAQSAFFFPKANLLLDDRVWR